MSAATSGPLRIALIGRDGQLGRCLVRRIQADPEFELVAALGRADLDLADPDAVERGLGELAPAEWLVNAAAYTAVDRCEEEEETARRVNADSPSRMARSCRSRGTGLVHVSTDFVFDGEARAPYDEDAPTAPLGAYGRTKLAGERAVRDALPDALVVRTSWVFGPGRNFVLTMLRLAAEVRAGKRQGPLRVVADQRGRPTYADDLAGGLLALVGEGASGLFHLANDGEASWWELARAALDRAGFSDVEIEKIPASAYPRPARVPTYSVLDCAKARARGVRLRPWRQALEAFLDEPSLLEEVA